MQLISTALLAIAIALILLVYAKVRKVHIVTYRLCDDVSHTRRETETLFAQLQALIALERCLDMARPLPPMRGWAASPDFLLVLAHEIGRRKPRCVVECSSGVSTLVIGRALQLNGMGQVFSLEHHAEFAEKTRHWIADYGLSSVATVIDAPLETRLTKTPWYCLDALPTDAGSIDILVVDGPPAAIAPFARAPALPRLLDRMSDCYIILVDDADRPDEIEAIRQWRTLVPDLVETRLPSEKGLALLEN